MAIIGEQLRAARALARLEQGELAERAQVSLGTIKRLEAIIGPVSANVMTVDAVVRALEVAGVEFINGGQPGVRMKPNWVLEAIRNAPSAVQMTDDELLKAYLDKGPCLVRVDGGGESATSLRAALAKVVEFKREGKSVSSIQIVGQAYIDAHQIDRLIARGQ